MIITASALRQDIYRLLDRVLETGEPLEIERNGKRLLVTLADAPPKLSRLTPHPDFLVGDPEDFVHIDWSDEWHP